MNSSTYLGLSQDIGAKNNALYTELQEKKTLLKQMQPTSFKGEGPKIKKEAEIWNESMNDYFSVAGTTPTNQSMLARFCLFGNAKLWWKQWCKDQEVTKHSQGWPEIKQAVKDCYLPPTHESIKMNEFFSL